MQRNKKMIIGISIGDIAGIGPEVIIKTFQDDRMFDICTPILFGNPKVISFYKNMLNVDKIRYNSVKSFDHLSSNSLNISLAWDGEITIQPGKPNEETGKCAYMSILKACEALKAGKIDALVTAPIDKSVLTHEDFQSKGHTGYITRFFEAKDSLMLMVQDQLRIGVITEHVPISEVSKHITKELIQRKIQIAHKSLQNDFGIDAPKIAVLGLNPHAGDSGAIGNEENDIIIPAVDELRKTKIQVFGPYSADGFFGTAQYQKFDCILAMYHDQGLLPFKMLAFEEGVNFTAGLSVIRTSPDHGTAMNIAGKGAADHSSFNAAIYGAIDIWKSRKQVASEAVLAE